MVDIQEVPQDMMEQIHDLDEYGFQIIGCHDFEAPPEQVVAKLNEFITSAKKSNESFDELQILALGSLLGWRYVNGLNWHWGYVHWSDQDETSVAGILNEDNSLFINPMAWVNDVLNSERSPNFMVNYSMVAVNEVPKGKPNSALVIN